jgi:hypothetical protein
MFGSAELDEDSIKYFAKNDFTSRQPGWVRGTDLHLHKCLEKLTCRGGVASWKDTGSD